MFLKIRSLFSREHVTTLADIIGALLIVCGVDLLANTGAAFITAGVLTLAFSYLVA